MTFQIYICNRKNLGYYQAKRSTKKNEDCQAKFTVKKANPNPQDQRSLIYFSNSFWKTLIVIIIICNDCNFSVFFKASSEILFTRNQRQKVYLPCNFIIYLVSWVSGDSFIIDVNPFFVHEVIYGWMTFDHMFKKIIHWLNELFTFRYLIRGCLSHTHQVDRNCLRVPSIINREIETLLQSGLPRYIKTFSTFLFSN